MTSPSPVPPLSSARERFRVSNLQIYNWGTFSGVHDIPIADKGFLFVGRSGTGKTTLLDAFSALLIPPRWIDFNAAAREADRSGRDRSLVSYVRGAWAEQKADASGEIATQYLRDRATWSALALSYGNSLGRTVVLVRLLWLRGTTNQTADLRQHFVIFERPFDIREIKDFEFDIRKLKQAFPEGFFRDEFSSYRERFCRLLGIDSEQALRLLHKTQSAKNLGDLNTFLRDFMLDKPETFQAADQLVTEFSELNAAHQEVVKAREQIQMLLPAREDHRRLEGVRIRQDELRKLRAGVDGYKQTRRIALLEERIREVGVQVEGQEADEQRRKATLTNEERFLDDLRQKHREQGGERIERLETERSALERDRDRRLTKQGQTKAECAKLDWLLPDSPQAFTELCARARREVEIWPELRKQVQREQFALSGEKAEKEKEFAVTATEVRSLERQPSNIPARMLDLRIRITKGLGLAESALPFVGEMVEVLPAEVAWRGAVERVLHGFALSLLVEERHYNAVSAFVNDEHLGGRIVYFRVGTAETSPRPIGPNSLFQKLKTRDGAFRAWLEAELRRHFDYACVDSIQAFRASERALTRTGQVKRGKAHHEKDDRFGINDASQWVLGFDNREKLALFRQRAQLAAVAIADLQRRLNALAETEEKQGQRALICQTLSNVQWEDIDVVPLLHRISDIERELKEIRESNIALTEIGKAVDRQRDRVKAAQAEVVKATVEVRKLREEITRRNQELEGLRLSSLLTTPSLSETAELAKRFADKIQVLSLDNLDRCAHLVDRVLGDDLEALAQDGNSLVRLIEDRFAEFQRRWPTDAGDMDASLASSADYFSRLKRLETDRLPEYEQRFFDLLENQSHQNLAALSTHLNQARKTIYDRLEVVNESLRRAPFNPGTFLHIDPSDRQLPEVREFKQDIHQALSHVWTDDRRIAEERFLVLRRLVEQLGNQETNQRRWRELVLDVRQHVEFIGRELDSDGREVEVYRSGAGKSGGQRQKLATTCLAAALRYQLGGNDNGIPLYAPVVLDEAFDKADNEFTALAMNIFASFGFQMIVATPLKSVMTLEPFIGGACFVDISERRRSGILMIEYDSERQRLNLPEHSHGDARVAVP